MKGPYLDPEENRKLRQKQRIARREAEIEDETRLRRSEALLASQKSLSKIEMSGGKTPIKKKIIPTHPLTTPQ